MAGQDFALNIDRRRLLVSAAASLPVAGIVPRVQHFDAVASLPFLPGIGSSISPCPPIRMGSRMETARKNRG